MCASRIVYVGLATGENGVNVLLVQMVGAPTVVMCAMPERDTSGFVGGAHGFSHYDRVCVF